MPPPNAMLQQQKAMMARPLVPRPFGCWQVTSAAGAKRLVLGRQVAPTGAKNAQPAAADGEDETDQLALNGLLLSACSENETASASSSATEGMSAFTYALRHVFGVAEGEPSAAELHEGARAKLGEMGFRQTPLLKVPAEPAGLAAMGFVTLAPTAAASAAGASGTVEAGAAGAPSGQPAKSARPDATRARPAAGEAAPSGPAAGDPAAGAGAAATGAASARTAGNGAAEALTGAAPSGPTARRTAPAPPQQQRQAATSPAAGAAGATTNTTTDGERSPMDATMQPNEEKWVGLAAGIAASLIPEVVRRVRRKDFALEIPPAGGPGSAEGNAADAEEKWVAALAQVAIPAAIQAVPGIINAIRRRKDFEPDFARAAVADDRADTGDADFAGGEEKVLPVVAGIAASLVPEVIRAIRRRKDFAPDELGTDAEAAAGAEEKWVAALARAVVPAAISAVPGIINAVRGKDMHILPYPAPRPQRPGIPSDWLRPARGSGSAVAPRKTVALGDDASDGQAEGDDKFVGLAVGLAGAVIPEVVRAVVNRRKEFGLA
jgi:hypothetical protein